MEHVRREVRLGPEFSAAIFEAAFASFRELYNVAPERAVCAPNVLARYCALFAPRELAHGHATRLHFRGIPLVAAVLAPGTIAFEGAVDENRMGDW